MKVELLNDGPFTLMLESEQLLNRKADSRKDSHRKDSHGTGIVLQYGRCPYEETGMMMKAFWCAWGEDP